MSTETLHNSIRSRFKTMIADTTTIGDTTTTVDGVTTVVPGPKITVLYDNAPFKDSDVMWIRFSILDGETTQQSMGARKTYRTPGIAVAQIFAPVDTGDGEALKLADKIKLAFRTVTADGVTYRTPFVKRIGRVDQWWQINVTCPFYADEIEGA